MEKCLYSETITGRHSWSQCSNDGAFLPLLKHIYESNKINLGDISPIPEVSGVFRAGNTVVKLYHPPEDDLGNEEFYQTELLSMSFCKNGQQVMG